MTAGVVMSSLGMNSGEDYVSLSRVFSLFSREDILVNGVG